MRTETAPLLPTVTNWWKTAFDSPIYQVLQPYERSDAALASELKHLPEWLAVKPGDTLLDVACGDARLAAPLAAAGYNVIGLDISARMIGLARRRLPEAQGRLELIQGDMRHFQLPNPVDAAYCVFMSFGMFLDEADHLGTLQTIGAALKPGGRLYLEVHNVAPNSWPDQKTIPLPDGMAVYQTVLDFRKGRYNVQVHHGQNGKPATTLLMSWRVFMLWEMIHLLESAGFTVLQFNGGVMFPEEFTPVEHKILGVVAAYQPKQEKQAAAGASAVQAARPPVPKPASGPLRPFSPSAR